MSSPGYYKDVGYLERGTVGLGMGLARLAAIVFYLAVVVSSFLIIYEGLYMRDEYKDGKDITGRLENTYVYAVILAVSIGLSIISMLWDWATSRR